MINNKPTIYYFHASADLYGSDYVLLELVKASSKNYNVAVFLPYDGPLVSELKNTNATVHIIDLAVLRREYFSPLGIFKFLTNIVSSTVKVIRLSKSVNLSVIHTNTSAVWTGFIVALFLRKPHFWQVMEIIEKPKIVSILMAKIVGIFSYKVFCISDAVKNHFLKYNLNREKKFSTIYHGVDKSVYSLEKITSEEVRKALDIGPETILIGFAGRFNAWKGQEIFAQAAKIVLDNIGTHNSVHFLFMGSVFGDQIHFQTELENIIDMHPKLKSNSSLPGFQKDFQNWLGAMDILVLPSKLPEPNATVTVAAMTLGIPIVGTNIGGTVESIDDGVTGYLVTPGDPKELADKLLKLISSRELRSSFSNNAIIRANDMFSIDNYVDTVLKHYKEVIK